MTVSTARDVQGRAASLPAQPSSSDAADGGTRDALRDGLARLSRRSLTAAELRERLLKRSHAAASVEAALARLAELGYLDDVALAEAYVASTRARERASRVIVRELIARGVASELAMAAAAAHDDAQAARIAVARRLRALRWLRPEQRTRRLHAYLARRGFDAATAGRALAEAEAVAQ